MRKRFNQLGFANIARILQSRNHTERRAAFFCTFNVHCVKYIPFGFVDRNFVFRIIPHKHRNLFLNKQLAAFIAQGYAEIPENTSVISERCVFLAEIIVFPRNGRAVLDCLLSSGENTLFCCPVVYGD